MQRASTIGAIWLLVRGVILFAMELPTLRILVDADQPYAVVTLGIVLVALVAIVVFEIIERVLFARWFEKIS